MKYGELDAENVQDERNFSNYKITFVIGTIAATWALKVPSHQLHHSLILSLIFSITYLAFEILRMFFGITHNQTILDKAYNDHEGQNSELYEKDVPGGMYNSKWGQASNALYTINNFVLVFTFITFIWGAIPSLTSN